MTEQDAMDKDWNITGLISTKGTLYCVDDSGPRLPFVAVESPAWRSSKAIAISIILGLKKSLS